MRILEVHKKRERKGVKTNPFPNHSQLKQVIMKTTSNVANIPIWRNTSLENLEGEVWKNIKGYEGHYKVSNLGRIKSVERTCKQSRGSVELLPNRIIKQSLLQSGYLIVRLCMNATPKTFRTHRLVLLTFKGADGKRKECNHIDEVKTNNKISNLEWLTRKENANHGTAIERFAKKKSKNVYQYSIDGKFIKKWKSVKSVEKGGFKKQSVSNSARGVQKTHRGFVWSYELEKNKAFLASICPVCGRKAETE